MQRAKITQNRASPRTALPAGAGWANRRNKTEAPTNCRKANKANPSQSQR